MKPSIRSAMPQDLERILEIIASYRWKWDRPIAQAYFNDYFTPNLLPKDAVYVLEIDQNNEKVIVGTIGYSIDKYESEQYWLGWFYVHQEHQNHNYGKKLLNHIVGQMRRMNVKKLFVNTSSYRTYIPALIFYLKNGFKMESVIKNYYGGDEDQLILSKIIRR